MGSKEKFGLREATALATILIANKVFLSFPALTQASSGSAAWLTVLLAGAVMALVFLFYTRILQRFPDKSITDIVEITGGPAAVIIFAVYANVFFYLFNALSLREIGENMIMTALPGTPVSAVMFVFIVCAAYAASLGLRTLARACAVFFPIILLSLAAIMLMTYQRWNINYLFPLLGKGPTALAVDSFTLVDGYREILLMGLLTPQIAGKGNMRRAGLTGIAYTTLIFCSVLVVNVVVLSAPIAQESYLTIYRLARLVYLGRFVQRVEAIFIVVWVITSMLRTAAGLNLVSNIIARALRLPDYRPLILPTALLLFTFAFLPESLPATIALRRPIRFIIAFGWVYFLPVALWLLTVLGGKKGGRSSAQIDA